MATLFTATTPEEINDLLSNGHNINAINNMPWELPLKPLHNACKNGNLAIVKALCEYVVDGIEIIDINSTCYGNRTAIYFAAFNGYLTIVEYLISRGANSSYILHGGSCAGNMDIVDYALTLDLDINEKDLDGKTALEMACYRNQIDVVDRLIVAGAKVKSKYLINSPSIYPLPHLHIIKLLVSQGADVNYVDEYGYNVMHYACSTNELEVVDFLISMRCDLNYVMRSGGTALILCCICNRYECAKMLLEAGADLNITSSNGNKPINYVESDDMRELLESYCK
jgi:ankyrin repeat protein